VQAIQSFLEYCPNCGHAYGEPVGQQRLVAVRHPTLQMIEQRAYR
jgi:hypothetical protein